MWTGSGVLRRAPALGLTLLALLLAQGARAQDKKKIEIVLNIPHAR